MSQAAAFKPQVSGIPKPFSHQVESREFYHRQPTVFNMSEAGTAKTRGWLDWFVEHRDSGGGPGLVICTKSIMGAAWGNDAKKFTPHLNVSIATADRRRDALKPGADLYVINHDAVRQLVKDPSLLPKDIDCFNVDESTAFKSPTSQRSKAAAKLLKPYEHRTLMSGTPSPQGVTDLWHQAFLLDGGERLGSSFYKFRMTVCEPEQTGPHKNHVKWVEKPGAQEAVAEMLEDITILYRLEECFDMPERVVREVEFSLDPKHQAAYEELRRDKLVASVKGEIITAIHAASLRTKLLQMLSGAVYGDTGLSTEFSTDRYKLVMDLVEERPHSLVAFNWRHQREALAAEAKKRGISYAVIDGSVPKMDDRTAIVERFQAGDIRVIFAHPASAGHGLTLTRGTAVIWASPTDNAEHYEQFNARIYRASQTQRTEIIKVVARDTVEDRAYENLTTKVDNMTALLQLLGE